MNDPLFLFQLHFQTHFCRLAPLLSRNSQWTIPRSQVFHTVHCKAKVISVFIGIHVYDRNYKSVVSDRVRCFLSGFEAGISLVTVS